MTSDVSDLPDLVRISFQAGGTWTLGTVAKNLVGGGLSFNFKTGSTPAWNYYAKRDSNGNVILTTGTYNANLNGGFSTAGTTYYQHLDKDGKLYYTTSLNGTTKIYPEE